MRAFDHRETDRFPVDFDCSQQDKVEDLIAHLGAADKEDMLRRIGADTRWCVCWEDVCPMNRFDRDETYTDMWGVERHMRGMYPVAHPLKDAETIADLEAYDWPSPDQFDFSGYIERMKSHSEYAIFGGVWSCWLEVADSLLGSEEFMMKLLEEPEFIHALLDRVFDFYYQANTRFFREAGDLMQIFHCGDDYGAQQNMMMSPENWREFVKPRQKRLYQLAHAHGYKVMQHSCGTFVQIIPDLVEIGLDGLQPIQVTAQGMVPSVLKERFGKDLLFMGAVSGMGAIRNGTPDEVRDEVRLRMEELGSGGGYIVSTSQGIMPDMPNENILAMYETVGSL